MSLTLLGFLLARFAEDDCPNPQRIAYASEGRAWATARHGEQLPYRCCCGNWHLAPRAEAMAKRAAGH